MQIGCTKTLLDYLNGDVGAVDMQLDPMFCWSANLIFVNRRRTIVVCNDSSRCGFVLYGIKKKDLKNIEQLIIEGIRACFESECIDPSITEKYLADYGASLTFTKTVDRVVVAGLNRVCSNAAFFSTLFTEEQLLQRHVLPLHPSITEKYLADYGGDYFSINGEFTKDIEKRYKANPYRCRAVELEIDLELKHVCKRRVIVPLNFTFREFHHVLQKLFCWNGSHLHEFSIERYPNGKWKYTLCGYTRHEEEEGETTRSDSTVLLSEIFPTYDSIIYIYDLGDSWNHHIRLKSIIEEYDKNYPVCLDWEGEAPVEDSGGIMGDENLQSILKHPQDPDHYDMKAWVEKNGWASFNIDEVNRRLRVGGRL